MPLFPILTVSLSAVFYFHLKLLLDLRSFPGTYETLSANEHLADRDKIGSVTHCIM